jgi:hypothetical protein
LSVRSRRVPRCTRGLSLLGLIALPLLGACGGGSDALGPSTPDASVGRSDSAGAPGTVAGSATLTRGVAVLQLAGRAEARCRATRAPRVFVTDSAVLAPKESPAVNRVLAALPRLRLPPLLALPSTCEAAR